MKLNVIANLLGFQFFYNKYSTSKTPGTWRSYYSYPLLRSSSSLQLFRPASQFFLVFSSPSRQFNSSTFLQVIILERQDNQKRLGREIVGKARKQNNSILNSLSQNVGQVITPTYLDVVQIVQIVQRNQYLSRLTQTSQTKKRYLL